MVVYILNTIDRPTKAGYFGFALIATLVGMLIPWINSILFSDVISIGSVQVLASIAVFLICASLSSQIYGTVQDLFLQRIALRLNINIESATMMRILTLPSDFFKVYSAGDLANRVQNMNLFVTQLINMGLSAFVTALFSFIYILQIISFAPALAVPAFIAAFLQMAVMILAVVLKSKVNMTQKELAAKESGISYSLLMGIQKIKLSGAERRAFTKWGNAYAAQSAYLYDPPLFLKAYPAVITGISLIGTMVIYYSAIMNHVDLGQYYAFNAAFAMVSAAFTALIPVIEPVSQVAPMLELIRPILETAPEVSEEKPVIERLSGGIELNNITFRYSADMPPVLDDLSLKIRPGEYIAITGKTGCGKSTLMR
ncbi:MAG: ATP-binding cassette domain-containing protein, partial [Lachnospiraceae bacterium]|nr:ATP-binding cassette domain-containing protein [Lachnospiraceae bacterium]